MLSRRPEGDQGAVAVITALVAVVLFGVGAMAVDLGSMYQRRRATQTTADLAALAGAAVLPDATAARTVARDYVGRNLAPGGTLPPTGWDNDDDMDNGEIDITNRNTKIRVVVPRRTVDFGLAGALGKQNSSVSAAAAAQILSPRLPILPFFVNESEAGRGYACIKDENAGQNQIPGLSNCTAQTGDFGWLNIEREDPKGKALDENIALGVDHELAAFSAAQLPPLGASCSSSTPGVVLDGVEVAGANCVDVVTGNKVSFATDGLLDEAAPGVPGRLVSPPSGHSTGSVGSYPGIDVDTFASYLNVPLSVFVGNIANPVAGSLKVSVLDCPRFAVVPVLHVPANPQNGRYAISGFRAVFIDQIAMNNSGTQVTGIGAYIFPLDALPSVLSSDTVPNTTTYAGFGPRVPQLVE